MFNFLAKKYIDNYQDYENAIVRQKYGTLCSILSIIFNILLVAFKFAVGVVTNSIAIQADALNNLSDAGSNLASLLGFKLSSKHADSEHPYGHGRIEYLAGVFIAFLVLLVGCQAIKDSVLKIINPSKVHFTIVAVIILLASMLVKFYMAAFNKDAGNKINSATLLAASQDSINDVLTTLVTLVSLIFSLFTDLPVDGIFGIIVSCFVLKSGIDILKDTTDPLLGQAPDKELVAKILKEIYTFDTVLGVHDLMMHDYGPGRQFLTLHIEVNGKEDINTIHDSMDLIERDIYNKFNILTTVHMDPIDVSDEKTIALRDQVNEIVQSINPEYSIHDFRIVYGQTHSNLIFDILIPADDQINHKELKDKVTTEIKKIDSNYFTVIQIDHQFI